MAEFRSQYLYIYIAGSKHPGAHPEFQGPMSGRSKAIPLTAPNSTQGSNFPGWWNSGFKVSEANCVLLYHCQPEIETQLHCAVGKKRRAVPPKGTDGQSEGEAKVIHVHNPRVEGKVAKQTS